MASPTPSPTPPMSVFVDLTDDPEVRRAAASGVAEVLRRLISPLLRAGMSHHAVQNLKDNIHPDYLPTLLDTADRAVDAHGRDAERMCNAMCADAARQHCDGKPVFASFGMWTSWAIRVAGEKREQVARAPSITPSGDGPCKSRVELMAATELLKLCANAGSAVAAYELSYQLRARAFWLWIAGYIADESLAKAQFELGECFRDATGGVSEPDLSTAKRCFEDCLDDDEVAYEAEAALERLPYGVITASSVPRPL